MKDSLLRRLVKQQQEQTGDSAQAVTARVMKKTQPPLDLNPDSLEDELTARNIEKAEALSRPVIPEDKPPVA